MGKLTHTVKGPIASFRSADKAPIESLKLHFLPKQEGSGDPSPQNIRNILGWTGCNLFKAKKNLFDGVLENGYITDDGVIGIDGYNFHSKLIRVTPGLKYTYSLTTHYSSTSNKRVHGYDIFGNWVQMIQKNTVNSAKRQSFTFAIPSNIYYIRVQFYGDNTIYTRDTEIQVECGEKASEYTSYEGSALPLSWSDSGVLYGGYIDPVRGKIVSEWYKWHINSSDIPSYGGFDGPYTDENDTRYRLYTNAMPLAPRASTSYGYGTSDVLICNKALVQALAHPHSGRITFNTGARVLIAVPPEYDTKEKALSWLDSIDGIDIVYFLATPIEYDIDHITLRTFLDYNNFWSDMNDDTEVEYEFADRLSARKALFQPETRIVNWNQISLDGNFQDADYGIWQWIVDYGAFQIHDGIATWTANQTPGAYYFTGFTRKVNYLLIPYNHKILVSAKMRTSAYYSTLQFRIYGMVNSTGSAHTYCYSDNVQAADTWQTVRGFIKDRTETPPSGLDDVIIKKFKPLLCKSNHGSYEGIIDDGTTMDVKELMAFDLTQMFGLGNEPSTVEEFERICQINGIDLDTYQPYDTGTNKLFIMPM